MYVLMFICFEFLYANMKNLESTHSVRNSIHSRKQRLIKLSLITEPLTAYLKKQISSHMYDHGVCFTQQLVWFVHMWCTQMHYQTN